MANVTFLDSVHAIYKSHQAEWEREERRHAGGEGVLSEVVQFEYEETTSFDARKAWAQWIGFGRVHTTILAGHLTGDMPVPNYGDLGQPREVGDTEGEQPLAELFHYNANGVGQDGMQLPAFLNLVEQNAMATGFRWLICELPDKQTLQEIRVELGRSSPDIEPEAPEPSDDREEGEPRPITEEEVRAGHRPFWEEYSPLAVPNWRFRQKRLIWAIVRQTVEDDEGKESFGYYLLVRGGYVAPATQGEWPGAEFNGGGWWKFTEDKKLVDQGNWDDTDGEIPMWMHVGAPGNGTYRRPSIGQSLTMELGQISADVMNAQSEQRYNLRQAAKSVNYWLGMEKPAHDKLLGQGRGGSIHVAAPASEIPAGSGNFVVPTLANSAAVLLDAEAYVNVIEGSVARARDIMVRQIIAAPDASGARVEAEHASATAPLLSQLAATFETSVNTGLYFTLRRFGLSHEQASAASVAMPREFELRDVVNDIDQMLATIRDTGIRSPNLERALVMKKADEMDLIPEDDRENIAAELEESATVASLALLKAKFDAMTAGVTADANPQKLAELVGFTPEEAAALFGDASGAGEDDEEDQQRQPPVRVA